MHYTRNRKMLIHRKMLMVIRRAPVLYAIEEASGSGFIYAEIEVMRPKKLVKMKHLTRQNQKKSESQSNILSSCILWKYKQEWEDYMVLFRCPRIQSRVLFILQTLSEISVSYNERH